jgi:uncharacterized cupin superfamily protein
VEKYLVTKKEIEACEGIRKTHFLNESAQRTGKSLGDLAGITGFGFHLIEVEPGYESTELHKHYHEDECVYMLDGNGEAIIGEDTYDVDPGDFIGYRAGGKAHKLRNSGSSTLRFIVVGQRLDHDVCDYPLKRKRMYRNKGLERSVVHIDNVAEPNAGKKA